MELSEAMEILNETMKKLYEDDERTNYGRDALKTAINYIENESIPKEKIKEKIKELELLKNALPIRTEIPRFIGFLQELLGE